MNGPEIRQLILEKRVIITVGAGGVGKTTTAAAISVAAARMGKRVLCLTIDPARRLAESLGIHEMSTDAMTVDAARFREAGIEMKGSLTAMMLDTKRTFDELVLKYSSSKERAEALLKNRLYIYVSGSLAGTQEYMAMEKLVAVKEDANYDLIVLDTPPTANALDFLDAPERLTSALDSAAMKWFTEAFQSTGKFSLNLLARSAAAILRGIGKITGGGFLEEMAEFIRELNDLFGGFKQRAAVVEKTLRSSDVAFVLVSSPSPMSIREALYFSERLQASSMPRGAFVVNRVHNPPSYAEGVRAEDAEAGIQRHHLELEPGAGERLVAAHTDSAKLATLDARNIAVLEKAAAGKVPLIRVLELSTDVYDVTLLAQLGDVLLGAPVS